MFEEMPGLSKSFTAAMMIVGQTYYNRQFTNNDRSAVTISPLILPSLYPLSPYSFSLLLSLPLLFFLLSYLFLFLSLLLADLFTKRQIDGICDVCVRVQKDKKELEVGNKEVTHGDGERVGWERKRDQQSREDACPPHQPENPSRLFVS